MAETSTSRLDGRFWLEGTPYVAEENVGTGAYGVVCKALDTRCNKQVAIKKIPRAFTAQTLAKRALREVRILRELLHENIIAVLDMFTAEGTQGKDIYLVMDLMETDLHQILHSRQTLLEQHFQYFLYQLLRGLKYLHSAGIIHRDLKPSNLLLNGDCLLRIADFGMARACASSATVKDDSTISGHMTQYVSTRWYRAPEILFSLVEYDTKVDLWSAGCIFGEMLLRRQLFPGKDGVSQIKIIVCYMGYPENDIMSEITSKIVRESIESCRREPPLPLSAVFPKASEEARDLISYLLQMTPKKRSSADEILKHSYLSKYHNEDYEPLCPPRVQVDVDAIEKYEGAQVVSGLDEEALIFDIRRGTNYETRQVPPPMLPSTSSGFCNSGDGPRPREDPTDYLGDRKLLEKPGILSSSSGYDNCPSSASSLETIVNMPSRKSGSPQVDNNKTINIFNNGMSWPLDSASTSSAPPLLPPNRHNEQSKKFMEKQYIDKIRDEYSRSLMPKLRDKRTSSDASSNVRVTKRRTSRQEIEKNE